MWVPAVTRNGPRRTLVPIVAGPWVTLSSWRLNDPGSVAGLRTLAISIRPWFWVSVKVHATAPPAGTTALTVDPLIVVVPPVQTRLVSVNPAGTLSVTVAVPPPATLKL